MDTDALRVSEDKSMKKLIVTTFMSLALLFQSSLVMASQAKVHIKGMVCGSCSKAISASLEAKPEVKSAKVDLDTGVATVEFLKDKKLDDQQIKEVVENLGYQVKKIDRT